MTSLMEIRNKMHFYGYGSKNLDVVSEAHEARYGHLPKAYMARSPFGLLGKQSNLKKLVISQKHCGANAVFVPLYMDKRELQEAILALGETQRRIYVDRRKQEKEQALTAAIAANKNRTFSKHCPHCGTRYIADVIKPPPHCGSPSCDKEHAQYLELQKKMKRQSSERAAAAKTSRRESMPSIELDSPQHSTLQGYVYCIRAENGLCKIGRSDNVSNRFNEIKGMSPIGVYMEHAVFSDNYVLAERYTHDTLADYRHHGEWFDLPENILDWFISLDNYELDDSPVAPAGVPAKK